LRTDLRETILATVQSTVAKVAPGVSLSLWTGDATAGFVSDLGGRVYSRRRATQRLDEMQCPYAEVFPSPAQRDKVEAYDADCYMGTMTVIVTGYVRAEDQGDGFEADVLGRLTILSADLLMAVEAAEAQLWSDSRFGVGIRVETRSADQVIASDGPFGAVTIEAAITYPFNARFP
jgi:hypothetical protein